MKGVTQDRFGVGGNCMNACAATITGIPLSEFPELEDGRWFAQLREFLIPRGWAPLYADVQNDAPLEGARFAGRHMIAGPSPRGEYGHCCVAQDGELVWDPHPDRSGLSGPVEDYILLLPLEMP